MKHYLLCLFTFLFFLSNSQTTFQKTFGSVGNDYAYDVIQTIDKGYAVMGVMNFGGVYILKTDSLGNKLWSKNLGLYISGGYGYRVFAPTSDGGIIFGGQINYSSNYHSYMVKLDALGNITWQKMFVPMSLIYSIKQTIEGDYIAVGLQYLYGKASVVRITSSGNIVWSKTLPTFGNALDVIQLAADSSFITAFYGTNPIISRWNKNGNQIWSKTISTPSISPGINYGRLHENGNEVQFSANTSACPGLMKINKNGTNAKMIGVACPLYAYNLADAFPTANKGSVLVGYYNVSSAAFGTRDNLLISIDSTGAVKWAKKIGGVNEDYSTSVKQTKDKGIIFAGSTKSFSSSYEDIFLVKTDSLGASGCNTSSFTFTTNTVPAVLSVYTGTIDTLLGNVTSTQAVTISNPSEVMFNACGCVPPVASFTANPTGGMQDNSSWATNWYWTCTCLPGQIDSTVINKGYYGGPFPNGTYTVCLKVKNSCGIDSLCQPFNYTFFPVGVAEQTDNPAISIFPNPVNDKVTISLQGYKTTGEGLRIKIINSLGSLVYTDRINEPLKEISVGNFAQGLYFIQLILGDKTLSQKVVKE